MQIINLTDLIDSISRVFTDYIQSKQYQIYLFPLFSLTTSPKSFSFLFYGITHITFIKLRNVQNNKQSFLKRQNRLFCQIFDQSLLNEVNQIHVLTFAFFNSIQPSFIFILQSIALQLSLPMSHTPMQHINYAEFLGRYRIRQKLGQGGYGEVFRAFDCETKMTRAYKKIVLRPNEDPESFLTEIELQGSLAHPLVVKIFEFYINYAQDKHYGSVVEIGIISELGKASLQKLIRDKNNQFPIEQIINFAFHFTKLFAYFQDLKIVHRDIKPQNFVQVGSGLQCKLIDFGLCTRVQNIRHVGGSFAYMSPILRMKYSDPKLRSSLKSNPYKDDVYSFGLTLIELITRRGPGSTNPLPAEKYASTIFHQTQNQKLAQIIQKMLDKDEINRPDFNELYKIFLKNFEFVQEDPVNQIDGYSEKDLAKMNTHERYAVMKKRVEFQKNLEKTEKKKFENSDFRKTNKFNETEQTDFSNRGDFEKLQVSYRDREEQREFKQWDMRKKRHFGNEKVILRDESTKSRRNPDYHQQKFQNIQRIEQKYDRRHQENERQHDSPQRQIGNNKTVDIDKQANSQRPIQNNKDYSIDRANQNVIDSSDSVNYQQPAQQPQPQMYQQFQEAQQVQQQKQPSKFGWIMPDGISVTALLMIKGHIICGCGDGSIRIINPKGKNKDIIFKVVGDSYFHEGSEITSMVKDHQGMLWTASADGKVIKWNRAVLFTDLEKEVNYSEFTVQRTNQNGQKYYIQEGVVKLSKQVNKMIYQQVPKEGITVLHCISEEKYVIGYEDGSVYVQWDLLQISYRSHSGAVTSIQNIDQQIFTGSLDNKIKALDIKERKIRAEKVSCPFGIRNFHVTGDATNLEFFIATVNGRGYKVNTVNTWEVVDNENWPDIDVRYVQFHDADNALSLTEQGRILKNGEQVLQIGGGDQWHTMYYFSSGVVMGSRKGYVYLICE